MANKNFMEIFKSKNYSQSYKLAEQITGLFARPLIEQSGITSYEKNPVVLDNACGTGIVSSTLNRTLDGNLKARWKLTAGDFSEGMVEYTRQRALDEGWVNTEAKVVDMQKMDLPSEEYSHVYTSFAFPGVPDTPGALKECFRVLQPGGTFASTNWKTTPQISTMLASISALSDEVPIPDAGEFHAQLSQGWDSEAHVQSQLEAAGFVDVKTTAVTEHANIPVADFLQLGTISLATFLAKYWTQEQRKSVEERLPGVMKEWLDNEFGADGVIPLEPTAIVATARRAEYLF